MALILLFLWLFSLNNKAGPRIG